jgi:N-methylhydantoinase B
VETRTGGGCGVGNPLNRDVEKVRINALNRYISVKKANTVYGVVIEPVSFEVDVEKSKKLRGKEREEENKGKS